MSVAGSKQGQQARNTNTSSKRHGWRRNALIIGLGLAVIGVAVFFILGGNMAGERVKMEKYLNDKYGQEFVVENISETGVSLGGKGAWKADAYPKVDPSLRFEIRRSQTTGEITLDKFLQTLWTKQASEDVEAFLAKQLPENDGYFLQVTAGSPVGSFYESIQGETPNLDDMLEKHKDILSYTLSVRAVSNLASAEPTSERLNEALKVINFAKGLNIDETSVGYAYRDPSFAEKDKAGQQEYQYRIRVKSEDLRNIQTATDLSKYFSTLQ